MSSVCHCSIIVRAYRYLGRSHLKSPRPTVVCLIADLLRVARPVKPRVAGRAFAFRRLQDYERELLILRMPEAADFYSFLMPPSSHTRFGAHRYFLARPQAPRLPWSACAGRRIR